MDIDAASEDTDFVRKLQRRLKVRGALDESAFIFVLSPHSLAQPKRLDALRQAVSGNRRVIPVLHRDLGLAVMPPELVPFEPISFLEPEEFSPGLDELVDRLGADLNFDAFVSYSRQDMEAVDELVEGLWAAGKSTWVDRSKLLASEQWLHALLDGIKASDHLLFVMSPDSVGSEFCNMELEHAVTNNKRVIPVSLKEVDTVALPAILADRQWVDFGVEPVVRALNIDPVWRRSHTDLLRRAHAWEQQDHAGDSLLRGKELAAAETWLTEAGQQPERTPTPLQTELILASRRGASRRLWLLVISVSTALVVTLALTGVAGYFYNGQIQEKQRAFENSAEARAEAALGRGAENEALAWGRHLSPTLRNADRVVRALTTGAAYTLLPATDDRHRGAMAWSADGTRFAFGLSDSTLLVWSLDDGSRIRLGESVKPPKGWIPMALAFGPHGRILAVYDHSGAVVLWDVETRTRVAMLEELRANEPRSLVWSGNRLAVGSEGRACLYATDQSPVKLLRCRSYRKRSEIAWSSDARAMLWIAYLGDAAIWYPETDVWVPIDDVRSMAGAFAPGKGPNSYRIAIGTWDRRLETYLVNPQGAKRQASSGILEKRRRAGEAEVRSVDDLGDSARSWWTRIQEVSWCPTQECVAYRFGGTVGLWRLGGETVLLEGDETESMAWSPDGGRLARVSSKDVRLATPQTSYRDHRRRVLRGADPTLAWHPNGRWLALVAERAPLELWDTQSSAALVLEKPAPDMPRGDESKQLWLGGITVSHDGQWVAAGGSGGKVGIWATDESQRRTLLQGDSEFRPSVAWSPVADTLAYTQKGDLFLLDVSRDEQPRRLAGPGERMWRIAWSPDGRRVAWGAPRYLAIGSVDAEQAVVVEGTGHIAGFAWSPDGTRLASVNANGVINVRDPTGASIAQFGSPEEERRRRVQWPREDALMVFFDDAAFPRLDIWNPITDSLWQVNGVRGGAAWSSTGELAVGDLDGLRFFTVSGAAAREDEPILYTQPNKSVEVVAWSPDGMKVAFNGDLGSIVVLDVATRERCVLTGHRDDVKGVAWDPEGEWLVSISADSTVRRWPALWIEDQLRLALDNRSNWRVGNDRVARPEEFAGLP